MSDYTKKKRITSSKKKSTCEETNKQIGKFEKCLFDPKTKKVYHSESEMYMTFLMN